MSNAQVPVEASKVNEAVISQVSEPKKVAKFDILTQQVCCSRSKPASRTVKAAPENRELYEIASLGIFHQVLLAHLQWRQGTSGKTPEITW